MLYNLFKTISILKLLKSILIEISKVVNFKQTHKHLKNIKLKQCLRITSTKNWLILWTKFIMQYKQRIHYRKR
jgi:hypothetical protein